MPVFRGIRTQNAYYDSVCVESLRLENGYERCVAPESLPLMSGNVPDGAVELRVNACEVTELPHWLVCRDDVTCIIILSICPLPPTLGCFHGHHMSSASVLSFQAGQKRLQLFDLLPRPAANQQRTGFDVGASP